MPNEQLYDNFGDISKLEKERDQILGIFDEIKTGIIELSKYGIKIGASKSVKEVDDLTKSFSEQEKIVTSQQQKILKLAKELLSLRTEEAKSAEQTKQLANIMKGLNVEEAKHVVLRKDAYKDLVAERLANQQANKELLARIKIQNAAQGSEEQLLLLRDRARRILSRATPDQIDSNRGQKLSKYAEDLNKQIDKLQQKTGNFKNNVGNYANSMANGFKLVSDEINKLVAKQQNLQNLSKVDIKGFHDRGGQEEIDKTAMAIDHLRGIQEKAFNSNQTYTQSVRGIQNAYQELATSGNVSDVFLQGFKKFAAESKQEAGNLRQEIKALSSETRGLDLMVGAISTIASGFEAASGAASLFGADEKEIQKNIQKLVAIQSIANGVREVGKQITEKGTAANKAYNFIVQQGSIIFGKGTTAAQRFGAALKGIGILAAITVFIQLVQYLSDTEDKAEDAKKALEKLNDELERNRDIVASLAKSDEYDFKRRIERIKSQFSEQKKLSKSEQDDIKINQSEKRALYEEEFNYRQSQSRKLAKQLENAEEDLLRAEIKQNQYKQSLVRQGIKTISKERNEAYNEELKALKKNRDDVKNSLSQSNRDLNILRDNELNDDLAKQAERANKLRDEEKKAALDLFKYRKGLIVEQKNFEQSDDSVLGRDFKIQAAKDSAEAQKAIITKQAQYELEQNDIVSSQIKKIREERNEALYKIDLSLSHRIDALRLQEVQKRQADAEEDARRFEEEMQERVNSSIAADQKNFDKQNQASEKLRADSLKKAAEDFKKESENKDLNEKEKVDLINKYNGKKVEIENAYNLQIIYNQIEFYQKQLNILKLFGEDTTEAENNLAKARAEAASFGTEGVVNTLQTEADAIKAQQERWKELGATIVDTMENVLGGVYEKRKQEIQDQMDDIDKLKAAEIDRISKTSEAEEIKATKVKLIEAKAQSDKEALERKQRGIDRQKAIFERAFKAFQIISDTRKAVTGINLAAAEAYSKSAAAYPFPAGQAAANAARFSVLAQIPFTLASSAAGLVALLATPLPKYGAGTGSSLAGKALVGEAGRELGITPKGKAILWEKPTIADLDHGTKIYSNSVTERILAANNEYKMHVSRDGRLEIKQVDRTDEVIEQLEKIYNKPPIHITNAQGIESTVWYLKNMKY